MVEKIYPKDGRETVKDSDEFYLSGSSLKKINELIDVVNRIDPIVQNLVNTSIEDGARMMSLKDSLNAVKEMVNVHEKEIDRLQMLVEPEKCDYYQSENGKIRLTTPILLREKWIGHLCKFWDDDDKFCFGLLSEIDKGSVYPFCCAPSETYWEHCELVKPDSPFIYRGDKNVIQ